MISNRNFLRFSFRLFKILKSLSPLRHPCRMCGDFFGWCSSELWQLGPRPGLGAHTRPHSAARGAGACTQPALRGAGLGVSASVAGAGAWGLSQSGLPIDSARLRHPCRIGATSRRSCRVVAPRALVRDPPRTSFRCRVQEDCPPPSAVTRRPSVLLGRTPQLAAELPLRRSSSVGVDVVVSFTSRPPSAPGLAFSGSRL